ncbi:MAG: metal-sulfur cluster assembly factor [Thermoplasmata archaeon]|nr:metal-sulfur cluster assembly factor [Thermoplasmata archaeon]
MVKEEDIIDVLKTVIDPEIGLDVINLGLVYEIKVNDDNVYIKMTMTTPGCPLTSWILADAENKIKQVPGVKDVQIELVWDPPWSVDRISEEARKLLGL